MGAANSKLSFKQSVFRLFEDTNISPADEFWAQFWEVPETTDDIFALFSPTDVRRTRDTALVNLEQLIVNVVERLVFLLRQSQVHYASNSNSATGPTSDISGDGSSIDAVVATRQTVNCMRILTRVMPFIYEKPELADWVENLFWDADSEVVNSQNRDTMDPTVIPIAVSEDFDNRPLGAALIDTLTDLLFLPGFSLPITPGRDSGVAYTIWATGIGSTTPVGTTTQFDSNKIETLRTILVMCSQALYRTSGTLPVKGVRFTSYIVCNPEKRVVLGTLCSLLNIALKYNPGWRVPYNHVMFSDPRQVLVTYSLQLLTVLVTYAVPEDERIDVLGIDVSHLDADNQKAHTRNWYRFYLGRLHRMTDLQFLADGMSKILNQPMQQGAYYLSGAQISLDWSTEVVILFWELIRHNSRFRNYIISSDRVHDFIVLLLFYAYKYHLDMSRIGLVRLCIYVLLSISTDSVFSVRLNRHFDSHSALPVIMRISGWRGGSYADYLLLSLYNLMTTGKGEFRGLFPTMLDIQINLAPHISNVGSLTCYRMLNLFSAFSSPTFMFENEANHMLTEKMIQTFNGMISNNNLQSNANLIYMILRNRNKFKALYDLTFERGMEEISLHRRSASGHRGIDSKDDVVIFFDTDNNNTGSGTSTNAKGKTKKVEGRTPVAADSSLESGFIPNRQWFIAWHLNLPLELVMHLLDTLPNVIPNINALSLVSPTGPISRSVSPSKDSVDAEVIKALRQLDDDVVLPASYERTFREPTGFEWSVATKGWYYSVLWGAVFVAHDAQVESGIVGQSSAGNGIWRGSKIQLFRVQETKAAGPSLMRPRGAIDAVAQSVLDRFGKSTKTDVPTQP
ncbi:high-temperature-induced dauer-formation protein-domain-containing protein [Dipodascopsis uninucleata]